MRFESAKFNMYFLIYLITPFVFWDGFGVFELNYFAIANYLLASFSLASLCSSSKTESLSSSYWIFVYIFLVIAPVSQQISGYYPWPSSYDDYYLLHSWVLVFLCNASYFLFNTFCRKKNEKSYCYQFSDLKMNYFIAFSFAATFYSLNYIGGFSNLFLSRDDFSGIFGDDISSSMVIQSLFRIPFFIISLYYLDRCFLEKSKSHHKKILFLFIFFATFTIVLNNPLSTPRFWIACIIVTYMLVISSHLKLNVNSLYINSLVFLTIFVFPISDVFRRSLDVSIIDYIYENKISEGFIFSPNYDSFQQITNAIIFVDINGYSYGGRLLSALFFWVPRSVFEFKHNSSGEDLALFARYDYTNLSTPFWAEMYLDFGLIGAIFIFALIGSLVSKFDRSTFSNPNIIIFFVAAYGLYFLRGTLLSVIGFLAVTLFLFLILKRSKLLGVKF